MALTKEQQTQLAGIIDPIARPLFLQFAKSMNAMRLLKLALDSGNKDLIDTMDAGEALPTGTGLAGAKPLTKEQLLQLLGVLDYVLALDTNQSKTLALAVGGLPALVG